MRRLIDEDDVIRIVEFECGEWIGLARTIINGIKKIPCYVPDTNVGDTISRQAAIDALTEYGAGRTVYISVGEAVSRLEQLPSAQPEIANQTEESSQNVPNGELISKKAAIEALEKMSANYGKIGRREWHPHIEECKAELSMLPSAQPERTCVNCGRTVNNGGWYADGGTRCPIEEHYALPKDGYCHLWEERNITDDDYPERREE